MLARIREDIRSVLERDPAAYSWFQVLLCYPGLHAVWMHRAANRFWRWRWRLMAHLIARLSRWLTGIEIHPAAKLGCRLFIDHGMGVVIGETAEVGADVTIYHGVTLGGVDLTHGKRHPTLQDGVVVGAGAKILGPITIGRNTRIGANAVVVKDVEPNRVVVGIPGKPIARKGESPNGVKPDFHHDILPDVLSDQMTRISARMEWMEQALRTLAKGELPDQESIPLPEVEPDYAI